LIPIFSSAQTAFQGWSETPVGERCQVLFRYKELLENPIQRYINDKWWIATYGKMYIADYYIKGEFFERLYYAGRVREDAGRGRSAASGRGRDHSQMD